MVRLTSWPLFSKLPYHVSSPIREKGGGLRKRAADIDIPSPGRFFAAVELKALLAFLVTNYDFKLADGDARPPTFYFADAVIPDPSAELMFRKRGDIGVKL